MSFISSVVISESTFVIRKLVAFKILSLIVSYLVKKFVNVVINFRNYAPPPLVKLDLSITNKNLSFGVFENV